MQNNSQLDAGVVLLNSVASTLQGLQLSAREWNVLERRYGFPQRETLAEISERIDCTRERVRQIESKAIRKSSDRLFASENALVPINGLDTILSKRRPPVECDSEFEKAIATITQALKLPEPRDEQWITIFRLFVVLRALISRDGGKEIQKRWPIVSLLACFVDPKLLDHVGVDKLRMEQLEAQRTWTYEELAIAVLRTEKQPLHWTKIVDRARSLNKRPSISPPGIFNVLGSKSDVFVRVGQGTYGLVEFGMKEAEFYTHIIAQVLGEKNQPMTFAEVFSSVNAIRVARRNSIQTFLETNPNFYKSREHTYGLRSWLKPRNEQTLQTPKGYIEEAGSYLRLQNAENRGYHVSHLYDKGRDV